MARIAGKARLLGEYEVLHGDYRKLFSAASELAKAGPAEVQQVAKQYLETDNRTVATLVPAPSAARGEKKEAAQ